MVQVEAAQRVSYRDGYHVHATYGYGHAKSKD